MTNQITAVIAENEIEQTTAQAIESSLMPFFEQAKEWEIKAKSLIVSDISQKAEMKEAREARLALRSIRIEADKARKRLKQDSIRYGKAVQGVYNVIDFLIRPIEEHLQEQEDFEKIQKEREVLELTNRRVKEIEPYKEYIPYNSQFGTMSEEDFQKLLRGGMLAKNADDLEKEKIEAERLAKIEAEVQRQKEMQAENERLKIEAKKREEEIKKERAIAEKAKKEEDEKRAKEQAAAAAEVQRLKQVAQKEQDERERIEKAATEERELKLRQEKAENERIAKAEAERIAKEKALSEAPDLEKVKRYIEALKSVEPPKMTTKKGRDLLDAVRFKLSQI